MPEPVPEPVPLRLTLPYVPVSLERGPLRLPAVPASLLLR
jgi:hypothetical protein